jgi:phosphoglycerate dehydrogenase-like enzyme
MKRLNCIILDDYQDISLNMANFSKLNDKVNFTNITYHITLKEELINLLQGYEIVVVMRERTPLTADILTQLPNLKIIITSGMRNSSIDINYCKQNNILVCGTSSLSEPPVELTWGLILSLSRNIISENSSLKNNQNWQTTIGVDLYDNTIGIIGLGKIGKKIANIAKAFGMKVSCWSPNLTKERADAENVVFVASKEELLSSNSFISIHLVLSNSTYGLIGEKDLRLMRKDAYLINTSRANLVDQNALVKALQMRWIAGAGLDVFAEEPLPRNHVFRTLPNVVITPHLGYVSLRNYKAYYQECLENISAFLEQNPIRQIS